MSSLLNKKKKDAAVELFSVVCRGGGVMELSSAVSNLSETNQSLVKSDGEITFIKAFPKIFKILNIGQVTALSGVGVEAMTSLKFCLKEASKNRCPKGNSCSNLHLCPHFIQGKCSYGDKCRCSHDIKDNHTRTLLSALDLEDIVDETWLQLVKKIFTDTHLERVASTHACPEICKFYNNQKGCGKGEKCAFLHVCQHFVEETCKFGDGCKRDHDVLKDKHNRDVFEKFKLGSANCQQLLYILRGRERSLSSASSIGDGQSHVMKNLAPISPQGAGAVGGSQYEFQQTPRPAQATSTPEKKSSVICGFHLRGLCNYGEKCMNQHREVPYQWQLIYTITDASSCKDLSEDSNIKLECDYSSPSINATIFYHQGQSFKIDFDKMTAVAEQGHAGISFQLKRLSTESSAEAPPGHIFSTQWLWYWQDEKDKWQTYDCQDNVHDPNTTCSKSLEKDFLQDKESHPFGAGKHSYTLYYKKMFQQNNSYQTKRAVRRRPEFVDKSSMKEVAQRRKEALISSLQCASSTSKVSPFPSHWDPMPDDTCLVRVPLPVMSQEYKDIEKRFLETFKEPKKVTKIERIQNRDLWMAFTQKKGRMSKKASGVPPKEMPQLFHGTDTDIVDAICQQGFDWRMCNKHGTLYGNGNYFARDASYSHCYTGARVGDRQMLVARVLIGSCAIGNSSLTRPPPKDSSRPHGDLHDSCVNNIRSPSIYVVFDNNQCYPEYIITYSYLSDVIGEIHQDNNKKPNRCSAM